MSSTLMHKPRFDILKSQTKLILAHFFWSIIYSQNTHDFTFQNKLVTGTPLDFSYLVGKCSGIERSSEIPWDSVFLFFESITVVYKQYFSIAWHKTLVLSNGKCIHLGGHKYLVRTLMISDITHYFSRQRLQLCDFKA